MEHRLSEAARSTAHALRLESTGEHGEHGVADRVFGLTLERTLELWPEHSIRTVRRLVEKHGNPNEALRTRLIWYGAGPFKRIVAYRHGEPHNFPRPHLDLVKHVVDYEVPLGRYEDLTAFNGSLIAERTKGELAACCGSEELNVLALNLAHEIITGGLNVDEAREACARHIAESLKRESPEPTKRLLFEPFREPDMDKSMPGEMMRAIMKRKKAEEKER